MTALHLDPQVNHGWARQEVTVREPTLVMESQVRNGAGRQTIVVRHSDLGQLDFGRAERYGSSRVAELVADRMAEASHDGNETLHASLEGPR